MQPPVVTLESYPPVHRIKFLQGSDAKPGRCVIDAGNDIDLKITKLPRETDLRIDHRAVGFVGNWKNMRVVKCQRARNGYVRVVLEDQRWHLTQHKFEGRNYNERDAIGNVLTASRKTVKELLDMISKACANKIKFDVVQEPEFDPPARWAGKSCMDCLKDLLKNTGCRCVYDPVSETYKVGLPTGGLPDIRDQVFQPAPHSKIKKVHVHTYPKLFESVLQAEAAIIDEASGEAVAFSSGTLDFDVTSPYSQVRFRLWKVSDPNKVITEFRPKAHLFDPTRSTMQRGRIVRDNWPPFPVHQPFVFAGTEIVDSIEDTSGGKVFVTEHPVLSADGNAFSTDAYLITGYYQKGSDGKLMRDTLERQVEPSADAEVHLYVDWLRPVESDQADVGTPVWDDLHDKVADALHKKYIGPAATISNPYPLSFGGNPNVGEVEYDFRLSEIRSHHNFRVAMNFSPGSEGEIR